MKRGAVALMLVTGLVAAGPGAQAGASIDEKIAKHRQETQAKIAEHRSEMRSARSATEARTPRTRETKEREARTPRREATAQRAAAPRAREAPRQAADPGPSSPASGGEKVIEIIISSQQLRAWDGQQLVMETAVSTGKPGYETPRGQFSILSKERRHWSTIYGVWMPYAMRVVGGIFIHELPVRASGERYGGDQLGSPASGGCVRVGVGSAERLYNWAPVGTTVVIR